MARAVTKRQSERGEGSWSNVIMLIVSAVAAVCLFNAGPVFLDNFKFQDKLTEISRTFPPGEAGDTAAKKAMERAIEEAGLQEYLTIDQCSVASEGGIGGTRTVKCEYSRQYKLLPGMIRTYNFKPSASGPTL